MDDLITKLIDDGTSELAPSSAVAKAWPAGQRVPLPGPNDDVRPRMGLTPAEHRYLQGDTLPATSSVLISNSKYLNNPYYREAYVTQCLRRHGPDLPPTYMVPLMMRAMEEVTDYPRMMELLAAEKKKRPEFGEWLDSRRSHEYRREDLAKCEPGTLGAEIHAFLGIPGMELDFISRHKTDGNDLEYMMKRRGLHHDIEHMVTGFGANTAGENALSMVSVMGEARYFTPEFAQMMTAANVWITSTGYNRTSLHYHHALPTYLDAMQAGINVGKALTKPLFMNHWEDYLDWQLDDIAAHLGFVRGPGAEWDWTTEATTG